MDMHKLSSKKSLVTQMHQNLRQFLNKFLNEEKVGKEWINRKQTGNQEREMPMKCSEFYGRSSREQ